MTITIAELLKDSAYKLSQFKPEQIQVLEAGISPKETAKKPAPYVNCLVRGKQFMIRNAISEGKRARQRAVQLLEAAKCAVEIAIEQSEAEALAYLHDISVTQGS